MRLTLAIGALDERQFRPVFFARTVSAVGDSMAPLAIAFGVLEATGSASDLGFVIAAHTVASVAVLLAAGVWADRVRRERLMIASNLMSCVTQAATGLVLLSGGARLWELLVLQALSGGADGAFNPPQTAITPQVVSPGRLQQANALLGIAQSASRVGGPVLAAAIVTAGSPGAALVADAATFLGSAAFLARVHTTAPVHAAGRRFRSDLAAGWSEFRSYEWLWKAVALTCVSNAMGAAWFVFGPVIARTDLGGAGAWGIILAANSVGWVVGGVVSARYRPGRPMLASELCALVWALQMPVIAFHPDVAVVAATAAIGGAGLAMSLTYWFTTLQSKVPAESLSRVSSYDDLGSFVFIPLGFAAVGPIGARFGITPTLVGASAISVAAYLAAVAIPSIRDLRLD